MSFAGSQGAELAQAAHDGSYSYYLDIENGLCEPASGSLNFPWLIGLMVSQGTAMTDAIAHNAVVFCEPEWGLEGGGGGNESGAQMFGAGASGGLIVQW